MSDKLDEMSPIPPELARSFVNATDEYKVHHHRPPVILIALYIFVILWCGISWIPFYGY